MENSMTPYGLLLMDYFNGDKNIRQTIKRDDGKLIQIPVDIYYRSYEELFSLEKQAIKLCQGKILNIGAGTGVHSIILQNMGFEVCAIDVSEEACDIMRKRGVKDVRCIDFYNFEDGKFDTIVLLGRNIGIAGALKNLERFLEILKKFIKDDGQVLLNSYDFSCSTDKDDITYMEKNKKENRYYGEVRYQTVYKDIEGDMFDWLYIDYETLSLYTKRIGLKSELIIQEDDGNYLAKLTRK